MRKIILFLIIAIFVIPITVKQASADGEYEKLGGGNHIPYSEGGHKCLDNKVVSKVSGDTVEHGDCDQRGSILKISLSCQTISGEVACYKIKPQLSSGSNDEDKKMDRWDCGEDGYVHRVLKDKKGQEEWRQENPNLKCKDKGLQCIKFWNPDYETADGDKGIWDATCKGANDCVIKEKSCSNPSTNKQWCIDDCFDQGRIGCYDSKEKAETFTTRNQEGLKPTNSTCQVVREQGSITSSQAGSTTDAASSSSGGQCGGSCVYSQQEEDGQVRCYQGNCKDKSQNCGFNNNCGYDPVCTIVRPIDCPVAGQEGSTRGAGEISQTGRTVESDCKDNPPVGPGIGARPEGYKWKVNCSLSCTKNADCPQNTSSGYVRPETSNWCYGFASGPKCLMLEYEGETEGSGTDIITTCKGETKTWEQIDAELKVAGYDGAFNHSEEEKAAYNRTACPSGGTETKRITTHVRFAESASELDSAEWIIYKQGGFLYPYVFKDSSPGPKFIFAQFKDDLGNIINNRHYTQSIELVPPTPFGTNPATDGSLTANCTLAGSSQVRIGEAVTYRATARGAKENQNYVYIWNTDVVDRVVSKETSASVTKSFTTSGVKQVGLSVGSVGVEGVVVSCPEVTVGTGVAVSCPLNTWQNYSIPTLKEKCSLQERSQLPVEALKDFSNEDLKSIGDATGNLGVFLSQFDNPRLIKFDLGTLKKLPQSRIDRLPPDIRSQITGSSGNTPQTPGNYQTAPYEVEND